MTSHKVLESRLARRYLYEEEEFESRKGFFLSSQAQLLHNCKTSKLEKARRGFEFIVGEDGIKK